MAYLHSLDEILDRIRTDPHLWLREKSLPHLEAFIFGYSMALEAHGLKTEDHFFNVRFMEFIQQRLGWNTSSGWALAISEHCSTVDEAFDRFFSLLVAFRRARQTTR
jgi:hypothetical protein